MGKKSSAVPAPGARVVIRDEEWMVRCVKHTRFGGHAVHVVGTSELVRGKESIFLTELDPVTVLRPEDTELVHDGSPQYRRSRLYIDALLRRSPPTDTGLYVGHRGAMKAASYQLQPAAKALGQLRPRLLIADGVGLGKTIEVGVLLSELIQRGRGARILVVALKSILTQFQRELWARFTIPLVRLDSVGIQRVQSRIPSNMNPFYYYDRVIISIDTLKRDERYRRYLEDCRWDVVVVDECQHVAQRGTGSQRARLAQLLGRTSDALILTSATPHDGRPESFASLIQLLEPTAIGNTESFTKEDVQDYFIRRFKKDVFHQLEENFHERDPSIIKRDASPSENAVFDCLEKLRFDCIDGERSAAPRAPGRPGLAHEVLFRTTLLKAFLSSPAACVATIEARLKKKDMQEAKTDAARGDRERLLDLRAAVEKVEPAQFSKLGWLLGHLRGLGLDRRGSSERIVIFSERIPTLEFLETTLTRELGLSPDRIQVFTGTDGDQRQQSLVQSFGTASTPLRILLASDAASEGINLHYFCHRMVHFDLPWSLITLEQRNGRIDRFGQTHPPEIAYLLTIPGNEQLKGDLRILEVLIEKEDAAHQNLGDVASLMNLHDAELEAARIAEGIEEHRSPEQVLPEIEPEMDFLALLGRTSGEASVVPREPLRLLSDELGYARLALDEVLEVPEDHVEWHEELGGFTLHPPEDLRHRFKQLPADLRGESDVLKLTVDRARVMKSLDAAREDEQRWPEWQLFWEQHPVAHWLDDRVLAAFGRNDAPILRMPSGLEPEDRILLFQGVFSNARGQPVIVDWFGLRARGQRVLDCIPLDEVVRRTGLDRLAVNPKGKPSDALHADLNKLRILAVERAAEHMTGLRKARVASIEGPLRDGLRALKRWRDQRLSALDEARARLEADIRKLSRPQEQRLKDEEREVQKRYEARETWIQEGLKTEPEPFLRLVAVLLSKEAR